MSRINSTRTDHRGDHEPDEGQGRLTPPSRKGVALPPIHKHCIVLTQPIVSCNPTLESIPDLRYVACTVTVRDDYVLDFPVGTLTRISTVQAPDFNPGNKPPCVFN
jgi:hypothetical protein